MSADAHIATHDHKDVLLVPNAAIERTKDGPRVRLVDPAGGDPELRPIVEIYSDGSKTAVERGVTEEDLVLVRGRAEGTGNGSSGPG